MELVKAVVSQCLALLAAWALTRLAGWQGLWPLVALQAATAAGVSRMLRQPPWWVPIHLCFLPAALGMLALQLPAWIYLLAALLLGLVFWGTVKGDVPLFLSSSAVGDALMTILADEHAASFADLGAGIGTVVLPIAHQLPEVRIDALERAPMPWLLAYWRCRNLPNVQVCRGSLWSSNLGEYDVVFAYLSPLVMARVGEKVRRDMREGSLFISSSFPIPDCPPEAVVDIDDRQKTRLYCYRI